MGKTIWIVAVVLLMWVHSPSLSAASPWGANYFPNVALTTQDGETLRFFDDMIKDKIVVLNFIYTHCEDSCPLETAQLVQVYKILGDRMGNDVFFYSISIDAKNDTPDILKEYKSRFGAQWTFLTGKESEVISLRKKLGLYIEEIQNGSNNHNVSMIIGNQTTGRWMKRSPFENPYVLADQIGNWLDGWKRPQKGDSYVNAPKLRNVPQGELTYRTRCAICHSLTGHEPEGALGPDLLGVTQRREMNWLISWLRAPNQMLKKKDPIALALYKKYNNVAMPNLRLSKQDALELIEYMEAETQRIEGPSPVTTAITSTQPHDSHHEHHHSE